MRLIALLTALTFALPAKADRFDDAVAAWLVVDDATALPLLAELANSGDERAMLLLGAIDLKGAKSDFLDSLDRDQINAIMRLPGGKFRGPSRLTAVTGELAPVAEALLGSNPPMSFREDAITLLKAGETAGALSPLPIAFNQNPADLLVINAAVPIPDHLRYLLWEAATYAEANGTGPDGIDLAAVYAEATLPAWDGTLQQMLFLGGGGETVLERPLSDQDKLVRRLLLSGEVVTPYRVPDMPAPTSPEGIEIYGRAARLLYEAPEVAPIRALCQASCPDAPQDCVTTIYGEIGGFALMTYIRQPLSLLIPDEVYFASPRYLSDLRMAAFPPDIPRPERAAEKTACGLALLAE